jgi:PBSX family phage terminase large subunit
MVLQHVYAPRNNSKKLFGCRDPEVVMSGPAGTGKSRACLEKLNAVALKYPGMRGLIVRKTATSLGSTALVTFKNFVIKEALANETVRFYGGSAQESAQYIYSNGSRITVGGMDKATRIMSSEYDIIYVQEAIELNIEDWEALTTRLRNGVMPYQQLIADTNPDRPTHWLKVRVNEGRTTLLNTSHADNPVYFDDLGNLTEKGEAYLSKLDALTGVRKLRLKDGLWVAAEGLIYEEWDPNIHVVDRFEIPEQWTRYWTIDFGYTNPFVLQRWAEDEDGKLYLYAEQYHTKKTVAQHTEDLVAQIKDDEGNWLEPRPRAIICDHDAEGRATFEKELGLSTQPANKRVLEGIEAVQTRLKAGSLFLLRDSVFQRDSALSNARRPCSTEEEVSGYIWDTGAGKRAKEQPLKQDDHGCDAMRYLAAEKAFGVRPRVRFMG